MDEIDRLRPAGRLADPTDVGSAPETPVIGAAALRAWGGGAREGGLDLVELDLEEEEGDDLYQAFSPPSEKL
jgi:hypothetical protein